MKKALCLFILGIALNGFLFGQNKVLLEDGSSMSYSQISISSDLVKISVNGETKSLNKTDILCIIPEKGKSFTFRKTNNMKFKIAKKDLKNDFEGSDIPRLFAYKYYKSNTDVNTLYNLFQDTKLSQIDFEGYYKTQQQKIRSRATTGTVIGVVILAIAVGGLIRTISTANSLSYNPSECPGINGIKVNSSPEWLLNHRYYKFKHCA
jgi:hypothetical protein